MSVCTFFGHKDCPSSVLEKLKKTIIDLIEKYEIDDFYVGDHGNFDLYAYSMLKELRETYPQIRYTVVIAYLSEVNTYYKSSETLFLRG